jgi:hypothetical protein
MRELPPKMLNPRKATPCGLSDEAWYYVGPSSVDVFARVEGQDALCVRLTRRQLERAIATMDAHKKRS